MTDAPKIIDGETGEEITATDLLAKMESEWKQLHEDYSDNKKRSRNADVDGRQTTAFRRLQSDKAVSGRNGAGDRIIKQAIDNKGTKMLKLMNDLKNTDKYTGKAAAVLISYVNPETSLTEVATAFVVLETPAGAGQSNSAYILDKMEISNGKAQTMAKEARLRSYLMHKVGFVMSHKYIDLKNTCGMVGTMTKGITRRSANYKNEQAIFIDPSGTFRVDKEQPYAFYSGAYKKRPGDE